MTTYDTKTLESVFGPGSSGSTPEDRARTSKRLYVRSLDQLAEDAPEATGRRLTAREALDAYGWEVLVEVQDEGTAVLCAGPNAAGRALHDRRVALNLELKHVATRAGLSTDVVKDAEATSTRVPVRWYERVAQALGLDERYVSVRPEPTGNERLAVRLRTLGAENPRMSPNDVTAIAEAAWVASTQIRLERQLGFEPRAREFKPSSNYGLPGYPPYRHGYYLADETRRTLGLGDSALDLSLREICEDLLGIPVIQAEMGEWLAGVTVQVDDARAIVANISGKNGRNVFVRRSTLAHELGHLLHDPANRLNALAVDEYDELELSPESIRDPVEQRANAFSVQLIAPQEAALDCFRTASESGEDGLAAVVDRFGISYTAARYQIWNGSNRTIPLEKLVSNRARPSDEWVAKESYAVDYNPLGLPPSRAGRFSAVVALAAKMGVISWDTAAEYLLSKTDEIRAASDVLREMFPAVFETRKVGG